MYVCVCVCERERGVERERETERDTERERERERLIRALYFALCLAMLSDDALLPDPFIRLHAWCVCVCEREKARECVCLCGCVCVRERENESALYLALCLAMRSDDSFLPDPLVHLHTWGDRERYIKRERETDRETEGQSDREREHARARAVPRDDFWRLSSPCSAGPPPRLERHTEMFIAASERRGNNLNVLRTLTWKPRPESGLECLMCAEQFLPRTLSSLLHSSASTRGDTPLSSKLRTHKTDKARFWRWLEPFLCESLYNHFSCSLPARHRHDQVYS